MTRAFAFLVILVLVGVFAALNWPAIVAPAPLDLGVTTVRAPLGGILLGLVVALCVLFTGWVIALQASALAAARRQGRELQSQRELADRAEASRFTELRAELIARLDRLDAGTRLTVEQALNGMAAQLGQLEDRLERGWPAAPR